MPGKILPIPKSDKMSLSKLEINMLEPKIFGKQFKLVIIGNSHVGKTSLMLRYAENVFKAKHISTIGVDFKIVKVKVDDIFVKLQIWDTAGQDRFRTMSSTYYRGADGAIIVYDVTSLESFNNVGRWLEDMNMYNRNVYKIIVGNKNDNTSSETLSTDTKVVSTQEAQKLAKRLDLKLFETSAKEDSNVREMFEDMAYELLKREKFKKSQESINPDQDDKVVLNKPKQKKKKKGCRIFK
jgi:Ras-related protein Rab-35